jgi:inorganic phosphate transporter, PiT family
VVILAASQAGYPLSPTHVTSGGVIGAGVGKRAAEVRWGVARSMVAAWLLTIPAAACIAGALCLVTEGLGTDIAGPLAVSCLGAVAATVLFAQAHRSEPVIARDV